VHSRIFQITTKPAEAYISESDFYEHWFTREFADYVSGDVNRQDELSVFREWLENKKAANFLSDDMFIILPDGKEAYFRESYAGFINAAKKTATITMADFMGGNIGTLIYGINSSYCDDYGYYVADDDKNLVPMDEFMRYAEIGRCYHIGGVLDYHF
jgi:hypothetical protein